MCAILGAIVVGRIPLSDTIMDKILGLNGHRSSRFILSRLQCLLRWTPGNPVQTLHKSFVDYLIDVNPVWKVSIGFVNPSIHHGQLAQACFKLMKSGLRFNICNLETSYVSNDEVPNLSTRIQKFIPVQSYSYACQFWADHLQETNFALEHAEVLKNFLYLQLLYWLEVLSLIKAMPIASQALSSTIDWTEVSCIMYALKALNINLIAVA